MMTNGIFMSQDRHQYTNTLQIEVNDERKKIVFFGTFFVSFPIFFLKKEKRVKRATTTEIEEKNYEYDFESMAKSYKLRATLSHTHTYIHNDDGKKRTKRIDCVTIDIWSGQFVCISPNAIQYTYI